MSATIHYCRSCDVFTLKATCPSCSEASGTYRPPKFSIEDKWESLKRRAMEPSRKQSGLL